MSYGDLLYGTDGKLIYGASGALLYSSFISETGRRLISGGYDQAVVSAYVAGNSLTAAEWSSFLSAAVADVEADTTVFGDSGGGNGETACRCQDGIPLINQNLAGTVTAGINCTELTVPLALRGSLAVVQPRIKGIASTKLISPDDVTEDYDGAGLFVGCYVSVDGFPTETLGELLTGTPDWSETVTNILAAIDANGEYIFNLPEDAVTKINGGDGSFWLTFIAWGTGNWDMVDYSHDTKHDRVLYQLLVPLAGLKVGLAP